VLVTALVGGPVFPCRAADPPAPPEDREKLAERLSRMPGNLVKCRAPDAEIANTLFLATLRRLPTEEADAEGFRAPAERPGPRTGGSGRRLGPDEHQGVHDGAGLLAAGDDGVQQPRHQDVGEVTVAT